MGKVPVRTLVEDVFQTMPGLTTAAAEVTKEITKIARRSHRFFERVREDSKAQSEEQRKERKRKLNEAKSLARRDVPIPLDKALKAAIDEVKSATLPEVSARMEALQDVNDSTVHSIHDSIERDLEDAGEQMVS